MAEKTLKQQANGLVTRYVNNWTEKYNKAPTDLNRYRDQWGFQAMIQDLTYVRALEVIDFYFRTNTPHHPLKYFLNNYEKVAQLQEEIAQDESDRAKLRAQTAVRVKEFEAKYEQ